MFLLDTSAISEVLKPRPDEAFIRWLEVQHESTLSLSVMTIAEVYRGVLSSPTPRRQEQLNQWFDNDVAAKFAGRILPVDFEVALRWATVVEDSRRSGQPLPVIDSLIAATALAHKLTVVTRNVRDFERCGVPVFSPWSNA